MPKEVVCIQKGQKQCYIRATKSQDRIFLSQTFGEVQLTSVYWKLMKRATDPKAQKTNPACEETMAL